jgi:hypothetical protein
MQKDLLVIFHKEIYCLHFIERKKKRGKQETFARASFLGGKRRHILVCKHIMPLTITRNTLVFGNVVTGAFQIAFCVEIHVNDFFYFLKIIFDISTSKRFKKYKPHSILAKKKNSNLNETQVQTQYQIFVFVLAFVVEFEIKYNLFMYKI